MFYTHLLSNRGIISALALLVLILAQSCSPSTTAPVFRASGYHVDQQERMQSDSLQGFVYFPDTRVRIKTTFDNDTIRAEIRTSDTITLRSMVVNGVSFYLDPNGKQTQKYGVTFSAARSEMMRKQEESLREMRQNGDDTIPLPQRFHISTWVNAIQDLNAVLTDKKGTRFVGQDFARIYLDNSGELVYQIKFAFSQLDTSMVDLKSISLGVVSELHQAMLANQQGGGGVATRPDLTDRNRRQTPQARPQQRPVRMFFIPVKGWILFVLDEEMQKEFSKELDTESELLHDNYQPNSKGDDVYFRP